MTPRYISRLVFNPPRGEELIEAEIEYTDGTSETQRVDRDGAARLERVAKADAEMLDRQLRSGGVQEHGEVMRAAGHSNSSEEFGSQEHSCVMDAILGRGNY